MDATPRTNRESSEAIDIQCTRVKHEMSRLVQLVAMHAHDEHRLHAQLLLESARNACDALQTYINSR